MALGQRLGSHESLLRHINPDKWKARKDACWRAFLPTSDDNLLSVDRECLIEAKDSAEKYRAMRLARHFKPQKETWRISVSVANQINLQVLEDPILEEPHPNPAHASVDMRSLSKAEQVDAASVLCFHAALAVQLT